jgi:cytoskeletal protein RodZ
MKVTNIVLSTVVAISAAGALGLAYAQSSYSEPQPGTSATTSQDATPGTTDQAPSGTASQDSSGTMSQDSGSTMSQDSTGSTATTPADSTYRERVARADRN